VVRVRYEIEETRVTSASRGGAAGLDASIESKLNMTLAELKLSVRAMNCLESENIHSVRDLVSRNEDQLLEVRNFGETTLKEVKEKLNELGLRLGMRVSTAPAAV
jgi:DNA-directed RNA polymerase subunit alpha